MAWRAARSLLTLHAQLKTGASRAAPPATKADEWGLIGDAVHDPTSDHSPHNFAGWGSQIVTAADFPNRPDLGLDAHRVLDDIRRSRDGRVKYGISNGQMFSSYAVTGYAAWTWRPYNPKNGDRHFTHGHLSVVGDSRADGTQPWATIGGDDMTPDQDRILKNLDKWMQGFSQLSDTVQVTGPDGKDGAWQNRLGQATKQLVAASAALQSRPAVQLTDEQLSALGDRVAAAVVAHPDTPLGDADRPAIVAAVKQALREGVS